MSIYNFLYIRFDTSFFYVYNEYIVSEWVVIMNMRLEAKLRTRQRIINKTALLLQEVGFLRVSSKEIARTSEVSQGTVFLHFETKENLLTSVIMDELTAFEKGLNDGCDVSLSTEDFMKSYIDLLISYEGILSRVYKDYGYLSENLKKKINNLESTTKNLFFDNVRGNSEKKISIVDSFVSIDAFYSQVIKYLVEKEVYTSTNSVIKQKRGRLLKLYRMLFE